MVQRGRGARLGRELGDRARERLDVLVLEQVRDQPDLAIARAAGAHAACHEQFLARALAQRELAKAALRQRDQRLGQPLQRAVLALAP